MKKSELKSQIKNEIIDILEAVSQDDVKAQQDYNAELAKTAELTKSIGIGEGDDQDDGYVNHTYDDSVIDKYNVPVEPTAVFQEDRKKAAELTKDRLANRKNMADFNRSFEGTKDRDEDKEPKAGDLKGDSVSILATKLQQVTKEMKQIVKKWSATEEGPTKDKLKDELRTKTKIKKELESLLENKK